VTFQKGTGNWTQYRKVSPAMEVDFHYSSMGEREVPYWEAMGAVWEEALESLKKAQRTGLSYVIFRHGSSTSGPGITTARSMVRGLMRSKDSTPYILRSKCIQHHSVFVAAIRPDPGALPLPDLPDCPRCKGTRIEIRSSVEGTGWFKCERKGCKAVFTWHDWVAGQKEE
jgi:hypothetical protein